MRLHTAFLGLSVMGMATASQAAVLWDQIGAGHVANDMIYASQIFEAAYTTNDVIALDNFTLGAPATLGTLEAVVGGWNGFTVASYSSVQYWHVAIWSDEALAGVSLTGDVADIIVPTWTSLTPLGSGSASQEIVALDLSAANVTLPAGTYYLGLNARLDFSPYGQIGVEASGINGDLASWQANPAGGFGQGTLLPLTSDFAYRLSEVPEPTFLGLAVVGAPLLLRRRRKA